VFQVADGDRNLNRPVFQVADRNILATSV
jgi:hypothetical protein